MKNSPVEFEYETIVTDGPEAVVFRVDGQEREIPRAKLIGYDLEGRFFVSSDTARELGLPVAPDVT